MRNLRPSVLDRALSEAAAFATSVNWCDVAFERDGPIWDQSGHGLLTSHHVSQVDMATLSKLRPPTSPAPKLAMTKFVPRSSVSETGTSCHWDQSREAVSSKWPTLRVFPDSGS